MCPPGLHNETNTYNYNYSYSSTNFLKLPKTLKLSETS